MQVKLSESPVRTKLQKKISSLSSNQAEKHDSIKPNQTTVISSTNLYKINFSEISAKIDGMEKKIKNGELLPEGLRRRSITVTGGEVPKSYEKEDHIKGNHSSTKRASLREQQKSTIEDILSFKMGKTQIKDNLKFTEKNIDNSRFTSIYNSHLVRFKTADNPLKDSPDKLKRSLQIDKIQIPLIEGLRSGQQNSNSLNIDNGFSNSLKNNKKSAILQGGKQYDNGQKMLNDQIKDRIKKSMEVIELVKNKELSKAKKEKDIIHQKKGSQRINQFQIGIFIGKGKFGEVFLARHIEIGFVAAIKKVLKSKLLEYNIIDQFIREIKIHNSFDHPHIVKFYGFFEYKDSFYLVLQYMNGGTLFDYLNSVKTLKIRDAIQYLKDVIEAVTYMHDRSIAHRDIKPENIVINTEGVAKLCDFGWAAVVDTLRHTYCGTLDYASPEVLQRKSYDQSVDVWSIGVLTYEMLMGRAPFEDKDRYAIKEKIINVDNHRLEYSQNAPKQAREFIEWVMQKDPSKRPKIRELLAHQMFTKYGGPKTGKKLIN